jgi:isopentenyl diphosphate isomerase/L-lactate dehydrogenase-like FMN-dependent dehydrogenase
VRQPGGLPEIPAASAPSQRCVQDRYQHRAFRHQIRFSDLREVAVTKARGAPVWFQLYASPQWEVAQALIGKADAAGCPVLMVTVDRIAGPNQETLFR